MGFLDVLFGNTSAAQEKKLRPMLDKVNSFKESMAQLSDVELRNKTDEFKLRLAAGETEDMLLPEAFAVVREAAKRTIAQFPYDEQVLGGIVLHQGRIAEMKTGEGKTLTATMPVYLNALSGQGVHIVTVNDYLANRDANWMGKIYKFLGMRVGCVLHDLDPSERKEAYACDITYGTNNEFGFDYLRDNMVYSKDQMVQRELRYAIVDEVDSILIDEARTPLIISGHGDEPTDMYERANRFVRTLTRGEDIEKIGRQELLMGEDQGESGDYMVDIKHRTVILTAEGQKKAEKTFNVSNISDPENSETNHYILQALKANALFKLDVDYVNHNGQIIIVDEFTGRLMFGRRYSDGLHQALEAKEGVTIERENQTVATITFQNYFRMYKKLAGMTGTAKTEESEFQSIYDLDVVELRTHEELIRQDMDDMVFAREEVKLNAVIEDICKVHATGQPILVGTISVEKSERLSRMLKQKNVPHTVLNAKYHEKEAEIVAQAGVLDQVTIATNMAGRGTDILLGGNPDFIARQELLKTGMEQWLVEEATGFAETDSEEILEARRLYREAYARHKINTDANHKKVTDAGGLYIIGTERHESRRIDNQLRGRAGRQGDPGRTRFYISFEDDLMARFGGERMKNIMQSMPFDENEPIEAGVITKQIEATQKRVEMFNFDARKHVIQYDDVMNQQREIIYAQRRQVLMGEDVHDKIMGMLDESLASRLARCCPEGVSSDKWDIDQLTNSVAELTAIDMRSVFTTLATDRKKLEAVMYKVAHQRYDQITELFQQNKLDVREEEGRRLLAAVDSHWIDHIDAMDQLRQGIGLQAIGQQDPVVAYRNAGFEMFEEMVDGIREKTVRDLMHLTVRKAQSGAPSRRVTITGMGRAGSPDQTEKQKPVKAKGMSGDERNVPCYCGSGKKYKKCHGAPCKCGSGKTYENCCGKSDKK